MTQHQQVSCEVPFRLADQRANRRQELQFLVLLDGEGVKNDVGFFSRNLHQPEVPADEYGGGPPGFDSLRQLQQPQVTSAPHPT